MEKPRPEEIVFRGLTRLQLKSLCIGIIFGMAGVLLCMAMDLTRYGYKWFCNLIYLLLTVIGYCVGLKIFKNK